MICTPDGSKARIYPFSVFKNLEGRISETLNEAQLDRCGIYRIDGLLMDTSKVHPKVLIDGHNIFVRSFKDGKVAVAEVRPCGSVSHFTFF